MMENKSDKGGFWRRQSFLLPPLTAAVVLLCQQMASSNPSGVVTVNILLLVLNFFSYVGLLRGEKAQKIRGDRRGRFYYTDGICVQYLRSRNSHSFERYGNLYEQSLRYVGTGSSCSRNFAVDTGSVATNG